MKRCFYITHDINSRRDPKISSVRKKYGMTGCGAYWCLVEIIIENGGTITMKELDGVSYELQTPLEMLEDLLCNFELFEVDEAGAYSTKRIKMHIQKMEELAIKRSEAGRIAGLASAAIRAKNKKKSKPPQRTVNDGSTNRQRSSTIFNQNRIDKNRIEIDTRTEIEHGIDACPPSLDAEINSSDSVTIVTPAKAEIKEYGNREINNMILALKRTVGVEQFVDSSIERLIGKHCVTLIGKIGKNEFLRRLTILMQDPFHAKNCNKIKYIYNQIKGFIEPTTSHIS